MAHTTAEKTNRYRLTTTKIDFPAPEQGYDSHYSMEFQAISLSTLLMHSIKI